MYILVVTRSNHILPLRIGGEVLSRHEIARIEYEKFLRKQEQKEIAQLEEAFRSC